MATVDVDLEAALLELATLIPGDFAMYDEGRQLWKETSNDPKYRDRAMTAVKKWRAVLESRADAIQEYARVAPASVRRQLFNAAVQLRGLNRDVPQMLIDAAAALYAEPAQERTADKEADDGTEWSRPDSKKKLAQMLGCPVSKKAEWLNQCVKDGTHRLKKSTRQTWSLDLANVPENLRDKFRDHSR